MHKYNLKYKKSRGYAPGLAWVKYNQKLAFHLCDMIHGTIFSTTPVDPIDPSSFLNDMQHAMHSQVKQA